MSLISLGLPFRVLPDPEGSIEEDDRVSLLFLYSGIVPSGALPIESEIHLLYRRRMKGPQRIIGR